LDAEGNFQIFKSSNLQISTIYIGGGTPSMLSPSELRELLGQAASLWDCSGLREVTLEANPEELTRDYLAGLAGSFNRLSIGIQSFDDGLLRFMNRRHDARRAREAVREAQAAGFDNISIDLIYGIPGMTSGQWECTLREAIALDVQHISAYHLTIEPATPFGRMGLAPIPEAGSERQFETLREKLLAAGFEHYEVSNFALAGRHAIHNSAYWSGEPYLGVGPSAHSFDGVRRREWVAADVQKYMEAFAEPSPRQAAIYESETLSERELRNERIMTGLRTARGVEAKILEAKSDETERFLREGLLVERGDRLAIPPEKFLLSDYVIASLFDA
jgi:oxygen-independent coproporphyrinogen-3 oxidase